MPLQTFTYGGKEYFVDYRLRQFRTNVPFPEVISFIDFGSSFGKRIIDQMVEQDELDHEQFYH